MPADNLRRANGAPRRRLFRIIRYGAVAAGLAALALGLGFLWFVGQLAVREAALERDADGIVVFTGGAARIGDALALLALRRGKRLLITGVYPTTTAAVIARSVPEHQRWFSCCVDLDHSARNTVGNAIQTRRWAKRHDVKSLIVVTSNYHMPRALNELARALPDVTLIAFPVVPEKVRVESWWSSPATMRLLFPEYLKYVRSVVRARLAALAGQPEGS